MIGIKVDGRHVDTYKDTKVSLELVSPLLADNGLSPGSITFPFDIPAGDESPNNSEVLGIPDVLENTNGFRKVNVELLVDDVPYKRGTLIIRGYERTKANANLNFGVRAKLGDDFKTKKLADIVDEAVPIWSPFSHSPSISKKVYIKPGAGAVTPYEITVNGTLFSNATLAGLATDIAASASSTNATATYVGSGFTPLGLGAPHIEIFAATNLVNPLTPLSVEFDQNGFTPAAFKWLCHTIDFTAYNTIYKDFYEDNFNDSRFSFPYVKNDNPYGEAINPIYFSEYYVGFGSYAGGSKITNDVNRSTGGVLLVNDPNWGFDNARPFLVSNINSLQPFIRMRHVLNKIKDYFGFEYEGDFINKPELDEMFLWNTAPLDVAMDFIGPKKFVFYRSGFNLKELVPDMTVSEFFMSLKSRYNLMVDINEANGSLVVKMREPIARVNTTMDITSYCGPIMRTDDLRVAGFRITCEKAENNDLSARDQLEIDTPEEEVHVTCRAFTAPIISSQKIGSKFSLQVFYMRTPTAGGTGAGGANPLTGAWVETLGGEDGIYEIFWKYWLYFKGRRRAITLPVSWPFNLLGDLDWSKKLRFDRNNFMVKKIKVDVGGSNDVSVSEVELHSMI